MAKGLVYGSVDPSSIVAPFIDFLFFSLILWKFSKLEAGFGYITGFFCYCAREARVSFSSTTPTFGLDTPLFDRTCR